MEVKEKMKKDSYSRDVLKKFHTHKLAMLGLLLFYWKLFLWLSCL